VGLDGNEQMSLDGAEFGAARQIDFPKIVIGPASALHMGAITRTAKPDLDPETRRWFGRPPFAGTADLTAAMRDVQRSSNGAFSHYQFGHLCGKASLQLRIHQVGLVNGPAGAKSAI